MKGDFTRTTFKAEKHYSSVRMQQGRVQLDADWNEQLDITAHRVETETIDTIGECGGSIHHGGFRIVSDKTELTPEEQALLLEDFAALTLDQGDFLITPGRYYVDGILCESEHTLRYSVQPDLPDADQELISGDGFHLIYLHVWQRHITKLEDPEIREVALSGPDTATRIKTVWQVKHMKVGDLGNDFKDCSKFGTDWIPPEDPNASGKTRGKLRARADPQAATDNLCIVPPEAGYQRLENQLYRVEIHDPSGAPDGPTFKWSRENGRITVRLEDITGDVLTVSDPGKDEVLGFGPGQWVELGDERHVLHGQPGILVKLKQVQGKELTVDSWPGGSALTMDDFGELPTVRRWDMPKNVTGGIQVDTTSADYEDLEGGVQVKFEGEEFRTGDYWMIPARTVSGDILWPSENGQPAAQEPHGIEHHFCPLALVKFDATDPSPSISVVHDCRDLFSPLTEQIRFFHVGGTGQEAMPGKRLRQPLQVRVANGQWPVAGAKVKFETVPDNDGNTGGTVHGNGDSGPSVIVPTDNGGIAACEWELDTNRDHHSQRVIATLLTPAEVPVDGPPVLAFNANLSIASQVSYEASDACLNPNAPPTVKEALDDLCENYTLYYVSGDGQEVRPDGTAPTPLDASLQVRVANGQWPVEDDRAKVRFEVVEGKGQLVKVGDPPTVPSPDPPVPLVIDLSPGNLGLAKCDWYLDNSTPHQQVTATLVDATGDPIAGVPPIVFNANLSVASEVAYDPSDCPPLAEASTVQEALNKICRKLRCHDFLDDLRADGIVRGDDGELGLHATKKGPLTVEYAPGIAYVAGCRYELEGGEIQVDASATPQYLLVDADGAVKLVTKAPFPDKYALIAIISTFQRDIKRIVDARFDLTHLDEKVKANVEQIAATHSDRRQFVPLLAQTLPNLRYRDGRNYTFVVPQTPSLVFDGTAIWAANLNGTSVSRIDRNALDANGVRTIDTSDRTAYGAFDGKYVWFTSHTQNRVVLVNTEMLQVEEVITVGNMPVQIAFDGHFMWVGNVWSRSLSIIDVETHQVVRTVGLEFNPWALAFDGIHMWVSSRFTASLVRVKETWGEPEDVPLELAINVAEMAFDGANLWMTGFVETGGGVVKLDVVTLEATDLSKQFPGVVGAYGALKFDGRHMWIQAQQDGTTRLYKGDVVTNANLGSMSLPDQVTSGAFDGTHLWLPRFNGTVHKFLIG